ncbi:sorbosone dehydrogenase family protein [Dyadobacter sp. CY323]|uniref:PQQ-dependent sugar dehydrogenase n=1 Tax=Dyadobacter sp. CY323 TaxID=2907302 RepID=UPI001F1D53AD|nr:PQQ-dependent sugar dehydrogenase [Dyadobacter sp. CY323]MCE6990514.1 PQQ-dependent sugar dehydrogenase [Dyadobacter sp. CY323]
MRNFIQQKIVSLLTLLLCLISFTAAYAQAPEIKIDQTTTGTITGFNGAIQLVHAGDGSKRIFIVERAGVIKVLAPGATTPVEFINLNSTSNVVDTEGEGGLLSVAFHPQYETNGHFFAFYTNSSGNLEVARYTASPASGNTASVTSRKYILGIDHPDYSNHNGGEMHFGYDDGYLYLSTGDGGDSNDPSGNAQNTNSLLGKLLRIDVDVPVGSDIGYEVPADNPIPNSLIYVTGLRNPFRWSFDRVTHAIWIGDVGQGAREEIDYVPAANLKGANFGWRCFEGELTTGDQSGCPTGLVTIAPIHTYQTGTPLPDMQGGRSVIGGVVYRGSLYPAMYGYYIGMDNSSGQIHRIKSGGTPQVFETSPIRGIVDIGEDEAGELYAVTGSTIYHIYTDSQLPVTLVSFTGVPGVEGVKLSWQTSMEENSRSFDIEHSNDAVNFQTVGNVLSDNSVTGGSYRFSHAVVSGGVHYYRLKMNDQDGSSEHSRIIAIDTGPESLAGNFIRPSYITNRTINLVLDEPFQSMELVGTGGQVFLRKDISGKSGTIPIPINPTASGIYIVRLEDHGKVIQQKVLVLE